MAIWTVEETKTALQLWPTTSHALIAKQLGRTEDSVAQKYRDLVNRGVAPQRDKSESQKAIMESLRNDALITLPKRYNEHLKIYADKTVVFCDPHIPYVMWELFEKMLKTAKTQKIKVCCIGGDVFDLPMFSSFSDRHKAEHNDLNETKRTGVLFFSKLLDVFDKIYVISGNHDFRIFRFSEGKISDDQMFNFLTNCENEGRVKFSVYRHMDINDKWKLVHPDSKMSDFVMEGRREASKYLKNILVTHCHRLGSCYDPSGKFQAVGAGCLLDPGLIAYKNLQANSYAEWNPGFVVLNGDVAYPLHHQNTDWNLWTKKQII